MIREGATESEANKCFWLFDRNGLIHTERDNFQNAMPSQLPYARSESDLKNWKVSDPHKITLAELIHHEKVTILIGSSAQAGAFNEALIRELAAKVKHPIILPLSNPTSKAEAIPSDLLNWTEGLALIATGSPFEPVNFNGKLKTIAQCNNALVFPGLGLGILAVEATHCTENLLYAACMALSQFSPIHTDPDAPLLPPIIEARTVAKTIAIAVAKQAIKDGLANVQIDPKAVEQLIEDKMWMPEYLPYKRK